MRRRELTPKQKEAISKVGKVDDEFAINEFILSKKRKNVSSGTINFYYDIFKVLKRDIKKLEINKQLIEITESDLNRIIDYWQSFLKVKTINSKLSGIRPFYSFLKERKWVKKNPVENVISLKDLIEIRQTLEDAEIKKIVNQFKKRDSFPGFRDQIIFQLLLDTGIRINECLYIKDQDIDGKRLTVTNPKNNVQRVVYLSENMRVNLKTYLEVRGDISHDWLFINQDGEKLAKSTYQESLRMAARAVGIKKQVSPHVCRRTYAKRAVLRGIDPFSLQVLLGHSTMEITKRYVQIYGQDLEKQANKKESYDDIF